MLGFTQGNKKNSGSPNVDLSRCSFLIRIMDAKSSIQPLHAAPSSLALYDM